MSTMHIAHGWAELGFVDRADDFTADPVKTQTDFKHDCLCHTTIIDGVEFMAFSPACERPGHGCHYRYVSELATPSADPVMFGHRRERG
jgi:hypothetical protein